MKLEKYLSDAKLSQSEFAKKVECTQGMIGHICRGLHKPSAKLSKLIVEQTKGEVTYEDLLG